MTVSPTTIHALIHRMRHGLIAGDPAAANDWVAHTSLSVDETVILLPPPLPLAGVSTVMKTERHQNDSLVNG